MIIFFLFIILGSTFCQNLQEIKNEYGLLYPQESESREIKSLNGVWNFRISPKDNEHGFKHFWYKNDLAKSGPVEPMPVPSSYNDITENSTIRDHVGLVWYDRKFFIPNKWKKSNNRIWLRFGSVVYAAKVYLNGDYLMQHEIGHLPFEAEITDFIKYGVENRVTVACNNTLTKYTIPQGYIDDGYLKYTFDFYHYAGIDRPVFLYTTPIVYISDILIKTEIDGTTGIIMYDMSYSGQSKSKDIITCKIEVYDKNDKMVSDTSGFRGKINIPKANLWWPFLMHREPGYLYTLKIMLYDSNTKKQIDIYRQKVGIRTIKWTNSSFLINNVKAYLKGFGRHEDSDIRGKGLDLPTVARDYNLIKWVGANIYRTSHYPYAEELYDFADEQGIMIIDECPSVNTDGFSDLLLKNHKISLTELIKRDKNRPSVVMWSIANEPRTAENKSDKYFKAVADHVRSMDRSRPITLAINVYNPQTEYAAKYLDIISFNMYNGWYLNRSRLDKISSAVISEAKLWRKFYNKPVLMSEYGAESITGLHKSPPVMFSEDYQILIMSEHFKAFDQLRKLGFFIGEFIWNFADFQTDQGVTRVDGNKKGIFTRQRQPKAAAYHLRRRYYSLSSGTNGIVMPEDLNNYVSGFVKDEL